MLQVVWGKVRIRHRERYIVRIAYKDAQEQNEYGETPEKIFGVFSPRLGELSRICTRLVKWKILKKQASCAGDNDSAGRGLAVMPPTDGTWSSVNNSTGDEKIGIPEGIDGSDCASCYKPDGEIVGTVEDESIDFDHMIDKERRALLNWLRAQPPDLRHNHHSSTTQLPELTEKQTVRKRSDDWRASVADFAHSLGWNISMGELRRLETGNAITFDDRPYIARGDGCLYRIAKRKKR